MTFTQNGVFVSEMNSTCSTCRFHQSETSECRRNPPQIYPDVYNSGTEICTTRYSKFPAVSGDDWCGEHQPIPAPPVVTTTTENIYPEVIG